MLMSGPATVATLDRGASQALPRRVGGLGGNAGSGNRGVLAGLSNKVRTR
jgi:hypothetical protein